MRRIVRVERRRQELRREARKVLAGAVSTSAAGLVPSVVLVLERLRELQLAEELVLQEHKLYGGRARRVRGYWAWTSQPRTISASTASVTNCVAWTAFANVYGPGWTVVARIGAGGVDLGLDDARVSVVDGTEHGDGAAVLAGVADEQLPLGLGDRAHEAAFAAA